MKNKKDILNISFNGVSIILCLYALWLTFFEPVRVKEYHGQMWKAFRYYTNDGNIFVMFTAIALIIFTILKLSGKYILKTNIMYYLRLLSAVTEMIIFLTVMTDAVFSLNLRYIAGPRLLFLHVICPLITIFTFLFIDKPVKQTNKWKLLIGASSTILYAVISTTLSLTKVWPTEELPYPFLDVENNPLWFVLTSCVAINGGAVGFSYLFHFINEKVNKNAI